MYLSVSQTHSSPSSTAQPRPTAEPLAVSVSPERSCYQQLYDQPDNPNWALYAEITITNYTDQPLTIETIFLYPNHQFYGEDASTPVLLPEDAIVALRETGLWELHADQISLDSCPVHETWPFGENQLEFYSTLMFRQGSVIDDDIFAVGLASGYDDALYLVEEIAKEVYEKTGDLDIRSYIRKQEREEE
mgnify:FL=1